MRLHATLLALLLATAALAGCAGQGDANRDTDGDGLPDAQEIEGHSIPVLLPNGTTEMRVVTSDPKRIDSDGDGLSDVDEYGFKTDPRSVDTDQDGLLDGHNVTTDVTSEKAAAFRALGILEIPPGSGVFAGEMDAGTTCTLKPAQASSDQPFPDGLSDGEEIAGWNVTLHGLPFHVTSDPCLADTDRDRLPDDVEKTLGADPRSVDSDGDGVLDGLDADPLYDVGILVTNVTFSGNGTAPRLDVQVGDEVGELSATNRSLTLDVNDTTADRASLPIVVILSARDAANGHDLDFFGDVRGTYLRLDLLAGTTGVLEGAPQPTRHVSLQGADGTLNFDWRLARS